MRRSVRELKTALFLLLLFLALPIAAQRKAKEKDKEKAVGLPQVIWRDPGDVKSLDLKYGIGGKEHAPDPHGKFTFVKEDLEHTSPKFDVDDEQGMRWRIKMGPEAQPETAATRLLWAAGYFADEDYFLPEVTVTGLPRLRRGQLFVSGDGIVHNARLERRSKEIKKLERWDWFENPFMGTKEFDGLRVMMALLNNWDLKTDNNTVYEEEGERRYVVSDIGATFGKTGNPLGRSKGVLNDYVTSKFIEKEGPDEVDFVLHSRPVFIAWFRRNMYAMRTNMEKVPKHVPRASAKWLGGQLGRLSGEQIRDAFRSAGYTPDEVEAYAKAVEKRIAELNAL